MKNWYNSLSQRERMLVIYGSIVTALILLWLLAVKPIYNNHLRLNTTIKQQNEKLSLMQKQSIEIKQLQQQDLRKPINSVSQNPQQIIERSLQTWRLKSSLERMQSQGTGVRIILKNANADRVMRFLYELEDQHALNIDSLAISTATKEPGLADFRITIQRNKSK
jgi:type II secretory pathway component PulM